MLKIKRLYECGGIVSENILDVLPMRLVVDRSYIATMHQLSYNTPFRDVVIHRHDPCSYIDSGLLGYRREFYTDIDNALLYGVLAERLCSVIIDKWKPSKFKVIYHSSGYDSRLISAAIRKMHEDFGDSWLGDILFVCSKWEGEEFRQIMEYQGWSPHQYVVAGEDCPDEEYYADSLQFTSAYERLNGACGVPTNIFWDTLIKVHDLLPRYDYLQSTQGWSGYYGNELLTHYAPYNRPYYNRWNKLYTHTMAQRPFIVDTVLPFTSTKLLDYLYASQCAGDNDLRLGMLTALDPGMLEFPRVDHHGDRGHKISDRLHKMVIADYRKSWYGRNVGGKIPKELTTEFTGFWSRWSTASLCEHLIEKGHALSIYES